MSNRIEKSDIRALTLVELLVVITILLILAGVVLPMAQPMIKGRAVREAARQVQIFLTSAQAKAVAHAEYVGVRFERVSLDDMNNESPPPWNHVDDIAYQLTEVRPSPLPVPKGQIRAVPTNNPQIRVLTGFPATAPPRPPYPANCDTWEKAIQQSLISFGSNPQLFRANVVAPPAGSPPGAVQIHIESFDDPCGFSTSASLLPPNIELPITIQAGFSKPRFAVANSADLPVGTYVDLSWSGTTDNGPAPVGLGRKWQGKIWDDGNAVTLVFGPSGSLELLYAPMDTGIGTPSNRRFRKQTPVNPPQNPSTCSPFRPRSDVFLLVSGASKRKQRELVNFRPDSGSFWVIVAPQTGSVATTPNLGVSGSTFNIPLDPSQYPAEYLESWLHEMRISASKAL